MRLALLLASAASSLAPMQALAEPTLQARVLAAYPAPAFLENLTAREDGSVLFTSYLGKTVELLTPDNAISTFAALDVHPVSILPLGEGYIVAAHRVPFTAGPSFVGTGELLILDRSGVIGSRIALPEVGFANGMVAMDDGSVLIADSAAGAIHRYDPQSGTVTRWFDDVRLMPSTAPMFLPGANGLKRGDAGLIVSSSAARALYVIPLSPDNAPAGQMTVLAEGLAGADDFALLDDGSIIVATHGTAVVRIGPGGARETVIDDERIHGNTALAIRGTGKARELIVLGTGGLAEGRLEPGIVLAVPLPR